MNRCFALETLESSQRRRLLASRVASSEDTGATVCNCHQTGEKTIHRAIVGGCNSVEALREKPARGTECGSCISELKKLIAAQHARRDKAAEQVSV